MYVALVVRPGTPLVQAEAAKRDHRKLGMELDLFSLQSHTAGPGLVFWHPKGAIVREQMENFLKE